MAFSKNENKLFEECQRHISRSSGDDGEMKDGIRRGFNGLSNR